MRLRKRPEAGGSGVLLMKHLFCLGGNRLSPDLPSLTHLGRRAQFVHMSKSQCMYIPTEQRPNNSLDPCPPLPCFHP
jgi:hypothetical protein